MKWIWTKKDYPYISAKVTFTAKPGDGILYLSAPTTYCAYLNGKMVANSQFADYPFFKVIDDVAVTLEETNSLEILAYNMGADTSTNYDKASALYFKVVDGDGITVSQSDENTLVKRADNHIKQKFFITGQLGPALKLDFTAKPDNFVPATVVEPNFTTSARPMKKCKIGDLIAEKTVEVGEFKKVKAENWSVLMQDAPINAGKVGEDGFINHSKDYDGGYAVVDLGRETAGYLSLSVEVDEDTEGAIGWGEHLTDGRVRTHIGPRNFCIELKLKKGVNAIDEYIHRLGCRYLCIYIKGAKFKLNRLTLREQYYPFNFIPKDFGDERLNAIYEMGRRTLTLCAHEHYEDCPWREQALYGMDSRNQMLFGYGAFGEVDFARASLITIAHSIREDNLIDLCAPAKCDIRIPIFSLYFALAVCENAEFDFDTSFLSVILPSVEKVMDKYSSVLCDGVCANFTAEPYWNFFEWANGLDGGTIFRKKGDVLPPTFEAISTALYSIVCYRLSSLYKKLGNETMANKYAELNLKTKVGLEKFYDETDGIYYSFINKRGEKYGKHAYTQAIVACAVDKENGLRVLDKIKNPFGLTNLTISALPWKYDAIMRLDGDKKYCLDEIEKIFGGFIDKGLTSYPETEDLEAAFGKAGSLCHAWSSVPCYFLDKYYKA